MKQIDEIINLAFWIFLLFNAILVSRQSIEDYQKLGYQEYINENYEMALASLDKGINLDPTNTRMLFQKGRVLIKLNKHDEAMEQLFKSIEYDTSDLVRYEYVQRDTTISTLWEHKSWHDFLNRLESKVCGENLELFRKQMNINEADQTLRRTAIQAGKEHGWQSDEVKKLNNRIEHIDSVNLVQIEKILEEYGYPGKRLAGQASAVVFNVIQHSNIEVQNKYFPILQETANRGEIQMSTIAMIEDRILMSDGKKQKYGTQIVRDSVTGIAEFYPMDNIEEVRKRRKKVGLPSLETYAKRSGVSMN